MPWRRTLVRNLADSLRLLAFSVVLGLVIFWPELALWLPARMSVTLTPGEWTIEPYDEPRRETARIARVIVSSLWCDGRSSSACLQ